MPLKGMRIGFGVTGSHCTIARILDVITGLVLEGADITPILSPSVQDTDTRFGSAENWVDEISRRTKKTPIIDIVGAEPVGPKKLFDIMVVAPCSGNTLAKFALGITDTPVLMSSKAHLRNNKPLVLGIATNDGLGINARNLGMILNMKNVYVVPFGQDSPKEKINSIVSHMDLISDTIKEALLGRQIQPILREYKNIS
ncbi:MAG: dipicolinate synthase subunit B [Clostridia bacterium]|nr:dipicolinate synthase subunit B [Clostridia bacterium]